mmetsp:Transcript_124892/g.216490  ORF Transcript_124892/g.216490 Transcript_124892/m.216490 type:complete len:309 (-) Transcript_124892:1452-2378(-)
MDLPLRQQGRPRHVGGRGVRNHRWVQAHVQQLSRPKRLDHTRSGDLLLEGLVRGIGEHSGGEEARRVHRLVQCGALGAEGLLDLDLGLHAPQDQLHLCLVPHRGRRVEVDHEPDLGLGLEGALVGGDDEHAALWGGLPAVLVDHLHPPVEPHRDLRWVEVGEGLCGAASDGKVVEAHEGVVGRKVWLCVAGVVVNSRQHNVGVDPLALDGVREDVAIVAVQLQLLVVLLLGPWAENHRNVLALAVAQAEVLGLHCEESEGDAGILVSGERLPWLGEVEAGIAAAVHHLQGLFGGSLGHAVPTCNGGGQ